MKVIIIDIVVVVIIIVVAVVVERLLIEHKKTCNARAVSGEIRPFSKQTTLKQTVLSSDIHEERKHGK